MSRASAISKIATARRLLDEGLRELAEAAGVDAPESVSVELRPPVKVTEMDVARARARLRKRGFGV
jgi:hypothetical protein